MEFLAFLYTVLLVAICLMMALSVSSPSLQEIFGMTVGSVVALIAYVRRIFSPLESIGMEIQNIQSAVAGIGRLKDFFAEPVQAQGQCTALDKAAAPLVIDDVTFGYDREKAIQLLENSYRIALSENHTLQAQQSLAAGEGDKDFLQAKLISAKFYSEQLLPRTAAYLAAIKAGSDSTMSMPEDQF